MIHAKVGKNVKREEQREDYEKKGNINEIRDYTVHFEAAIFGLSVLSGNHRTVLRKNRMLLERNLST